MKKGNHLAIIVESSSKKISFWLLQLKAIYTTAELLFRYSLAFEDGLVSSDGQKAPRAQALPPSPFFTSVP